jgi:Domain of unknown function (DUF2017)
MIGKRRFTRDRHGRYRTGLGAGERELLRTLPGEALSLLESRDPVTKRVFPVAYPQDKASETEYQEMMTNHLSNRHQLALDTLAGTVDAPSVSEEEIHQWLDALEVMRLVLGTQLDVSEDAIVIEEDDERAPQYAVYSYLSMLQSEIIDSLAEALPKDGHSGEEDTS